MRASVDVGQIRELPSCQVRHFSESRLGGIQRRQRGKGLGEQKALMAWRNSLRTNRKNDSDMKAVCYLIIFSLIDLDKNMMPRNKFLREPFPGGRDCLTIHSSAPRIGMS